MKVTNSSIVTEISLDDVSENDVRNAIEKNEVQSKITSFSLLKNKIKLGLKITTC